jgi:hypothetical protein
VEDVGASLRFAPVPGQLRSCAGAARTVKTPKCLPYRDPRGYGSGGFLSTKRWASTQSLGDIGRSRLCSPDALDEPLQPQHHDDSSEGNLG